MVLSSQEENISLNKEMEELKVSLTFDLLIVVRLFVLILFLLVRCLDSSSHETGRDFSMQTG